MISQFFEIGDNKIALSITLLLALLIVTLLASIYSKTLQKALRYMHILEENERPTELLAYIFVIMVGIRLIHVLLVQPFVVDGVSMVPSLQSGEILLVDKIGYRLHNPKIGDIIVFKYHDPYHKCLDNYTDDLKGKVVSAKNMCQGVAVDPYDGKYLVKRIVALPHSTTIYEGKTLITGVDQYIVMGDNRPESYDSRAWGALDAKYISGRVFLRLLPVSAFGLNPAPMQDALHLK